MSNIKTALGFIAGASIGAIVGILLAPDSGVATRNKIIDRSGEVKDAVKDSILGLLDKLQKGVDEEVTQTEQAPRMSKEV